MNILIIGAGMVGTTLAKYLSEESHNVIVIDHDAEAVERLQESLDAQILHGEGTDRDLLREAGLEKADLVLAVTSSDESNIVISLIAHAHNPRTRVISRVGHSRYASIRDERLETALGRTVFISPEQAACDMLLNLIEVEQAFEVIPIMNGSIRIAGFCLDEASPLIGQKLKHVGAASPKSKALVVAVNREGRVFVPHGEQTFRVGDRVYAIALKGVPLTQTLHFLGKTPIRNRKVVIAGGGRMGRRIAREMKAYGLPVTFIEKELGVCRVLADILPYATVLHGDATDAGLQKETINANTTFMALTGSQEVNFLVTLLAHKLGAKRGITLLENEAYLGMASTMGIDAVVSPKMAAVGSILRFVRKGKVIDAAPMLDGQLDAIFTEIQAGSILEGAPLKDAGLPEGVLIGAVVRDDVVTVPDGRSILLSGDKVLLIANRKALPKVDRLLLPRSP